MKESSCIDSAKSISKELTKKFREAGMSQPEISIKSGIDQSQVSRILAGKFKRSSKNVEKLCKYAKIKIVANKISPIDNQTLMKALSYAWDGSEKHAKSIAKILYAIGNI
jgi:transcriptional regulator with XRE-family HTH domain